MTHATFSRLAGLALAAGLTLSAPSAALAQTKIVVRSDFKFNGYVSPLALAIERGFYKEAGLEVTIEQGQGSSTTVQTVHPAWTISAWRIQQPWCSAFPRRTCP